MILSSHDLGAYHLCNIFPKLISPNECLVNWKFCEDSSIVKLHFDFSVLAHQDLLHILGDKTLISQVALLGGFLLFASVHLERQCLLYLSMLNHYCWQGKNAHIKGGQAKEHRVCQFQSARKGEVKANILSHLLIKGRNSSTLGQDKWKGGETFWATKTSAKWSSFTSETFMGYLANKKLYINCHYIYLITINY